MQKTSARLLALLTLLETRRDWPAALLAERLEVSSRTVRRDVDRLRGLGYPVLAAKGPDGGYRLGAGTELPPLLFDDEQAVALAVALRTAATAGAGIEEAAARALQTLRQVMPTRLRHRVDAVQVTAVPQPGTPRADTAVLTALSAAVRAREVLRFDYASGSRPEAGAGSETGASSDPDTDTAASPPPPPRRVEPHHLLTRNGRWYLLAWDLDQSGWRVFRADRVAAPRIPTGPRFAVRDVPGGDPVAYVMGKFRGSGDSDHEGGGDGDWPCRGTVVLHLAAVAVAPFAADGTVEDLGPERCRLTLGAWSWPALAAAFGRFDADVEVVGPAELRAAFGQLARRFADAATMRGGHGPTGGARS